MTSIRLLTAGLTTCIVLIQFSAVPAGQNSDAARYWPQWRGPNANGVSLTANPPLEWSETKNIRWKVVIPGRGSSTPVVWGDRLFVTTAVPAGVAGDAQHAPRGGLKPRGVHRFVVMAIDRKTGKTIWEQARRRTGAARSGPLREQHLGVELRHDRRPERLRLFRVVRPVRV